MTCSKLWNKAPSVKIRHEEDDDDMELAHGWRLLRSDERVQRDTAHKLIVISHTDSELG